MPSAERDLGNWVKRRVQRELGKTRDSSLVSQFLLLDESSAQPSAGFAAGLGLFAH
jgi:hypothetical protein